MFDILINYSQWNTYYEHIVIIFFTFYNKIKYTITCKKTVFNKTTLLGVEINLMSIWKLPTHFDQPKIFKIKV